MPYIDIRFEFEEEDLGDPTPFYELASVRLLDSDISPEGRSSSVEMLAQDDKWHIDWNSDILDAMES